MANEHEHEQAALANFGQTCVICPRSMQNKIKRTKLLRKKLTGQQQFDFVLSCHGPRPHYYLPACLSVCLPVRLALTNSFHLPWPIVKKKKIKQFERASTSTQSVTALEIAMNIWAQNSYYSHIAMHTYIHICMCIWCVYNNTPILLCVCAEAQLNILKYELLPKNDALYMGNSLLGYVEHAL